MNIFKKKRILLKNNKTINFNKSNFFYVPKLEEINDEQIKEKVLLCIEEYPQKMINKDEFNNLEFQMQEFNEIINKSINIIRNICMGNDLEKNFAILPKFYSIISCKLQYYRKIILENKKEIYIRLIALRHIYENIFISFSTDNVLQDFYKKNCESYSDIEVKSYNIDLIANDYLDKLQRSSNNENLDSYKKIVYTIAKNVIPKLYENVINSSINEKNKIVFLEVSLEQYIYDNKDSLRAFVAQNFDFSTNLNIDLVLKRQEEVLKSLVFYGRDYVKKEEIIKFYKTKFNYLCDNINKENFDIYFDAQKLNIIELKVYKEEILKKLKKVINGQSLGLINLSHDTKLECINLLNHIFETNRIDKATPFLNNYTLFKLLMFLERKQGIFDFFDWYMMSVNEVDYKYSVNKNGSIYYKFKVTINEKIDFRCLKFIMNFINVEYDDMSKFLNLHHKEVKLNKYLYNLYCLFEENYIQCNSKNLTHFSEIPNGIINLSFNKKMGFELFEENEHCLNLIKSKGLILPASLIEYENDINFEQYLILNRNLKYLNINEWFGETLEIFPELIKINIRYLSWLKVIKFDDFENSSILSNKIYLYDFLKQFYQITYYNERIYRSFGPFYALECFCKFVIDKLVFEDSMGNIFVLTKDELSMIIDDIPSEFLKQNGSENEKIENYCILKVMEKIKQLIKEKSGYDILSNFVSSSNKIYRKSRNN